MINGGGIDANNGDDDDDDNDNDYAPGWRTRPPSLRTIRSEQSSHAACDNKQDYSTTDLCTVMSNASHVLNKLIH